MMPFDGEIAQPCPKRGLMTMHNLSYSAPVEEFHRKKNGNESECRRIVGAGAELARPFEANPAPSRCRAGRPTYIRALARRRRVTGRPRSTLTVNCTINATSLFPHTTVRCTTPHLARTVGGNGSSITTTYRRLFRLCCIILQPA